VKIKHAKGYVYPLKPSQEIMGNLEKITEKLGCSKADTIRDAIRYYSEYLEGLEIVNLRDLSEEEAKSGIQDYLRGKNRVTADRISNDLRLDLGLANKVFIEFVAGGGGGAH